jgi:hypothetical protein
MEVKKFVLERGRFQVQDGTQTRFLEDLWLAKESLMEKDPTLYNIVRKKNVSVTQVIITTLLNISFTRALVGDHWDKWLSLVGSIILVHLNDHRDSFIWTANKKILVKNMYIDLVLKSVTPVDCWTWKSKIPLKIKILLWYLKNGVVLTKDNLVKRQWKGCIKCCFCTEQETIQHIFFDCPMARLMWEIVCFTFGVKKTMDVKNLFGPFLRSFLSKIRNLVLIGMVAFC